ncbi:MAG: C-terminal binding protein [Spirochaetaceae bacterium]|jgi:D-3-phosphoglycerate dehydrogenase|nr:C-terminal binding protein [Spirochaetaceae bacterium]
MKTYFLDEQFLTKENKAQLSADFSAAGQEIIFKGCKTSQEVIDSAKDADAVILMAVRIGPDVIAGLKNLKFIGRCGIGYDNVDIESAADRGVVVCNVPDHCTYEVASHTFALMVAIQRQLLPFIARAKAGGYAQGAEIKCRRIKGQVLGVLGYGKIGRELVKMALGMGMNVLVFDPFLKELKEPGIALAGSVEEVLQKADVLSIHTPLTPETTHMISAPQFGMMKPGVILLNASRGGVINTPDLIAALKSGKVSAAGLDVCEGEPLPVGHELLGMGNVIFTPHVGMYSEEAMADMYHKLARQTLDVLAGKWTNNVVNPRVREKAKLQG